MTSPPDPLRLLQASHETLEALGIAHGLIGGWAVIAWGHVRATRDLDWLAAHLLPYELLTAGVDQMLH